MVMEVSSHALALGRADAILFDVAAFTNLGRDHLDFHGDEEAYFEAKASSVHRRPRDPAGRDQHRRPAGSGAGRAMSAHRRVTVVDRQPGRPAADYRRRTGRRRTCRSRRSRPGCAGRDRSSSA